MKKLVLALLLIANSLFAISLSEIDLGTHPRAFITQVDIRDSGELATKLNTVNYQYWNASYPYDSLKYSGEITQWFYTHDYVNFYYYSSYWDAFLDPSDLSVTYIRLDLAGYSSVRVYKFEGGVKSKLTSLNSTIVYSSGNTKIYKLENSSAVGSFSVETDIQATDGSVILGNSVRISRDVQ